MEIFYEQNVANPNIDKHKKRTSVLSAVRVVLLVIGIVLAYFLITFGSIPENPKAIHFIIPIVMGLLSAAPFVLIFFFLGRFLKRSNAEYDYVLNGDVLRIITVIRRTKRKLMATIPISSIESVGRITCEAYDRLAATKSTKKQFAVCDYEDEDKIVFIYYRNEQENFLLHIEPDNEMIASLRRTLPRMGILDKSMNTPVNPAKQ